MSDLLNVLGAVLLLVMLFASIGALVLFIERNDEPVRYVARKRSR